MRKDFITPEKYCDYCGRKMERKKFKSKYEDKTAFMRRKYCNRECMRRAWINVGENTSTESNSRTTARRIYELFGNATRCEKCGKEGRLDIHHKDENPNNNNLENLMCVCRSCHMKIHRPRKICSVEGCKRESSSKGYCEMHYQRYKTTGNPLLTKFDLRKRVV